MKTSIFTLFLAATAALWLSSCTSGRIASATEYDSVYFGKSDQIVYNDAQDGEDNQRQIAQDTDESRDDDFYYSRRVRRFGDNNSNWQYYDPYYSNDLYYSMGTPSWNTWNNYGWYNCTSPYIGSPWGAYNGMGGFGYGYGNGYYGCGMSPYTWGSYNPWVNTYYGYSPWTYGYCGYNYGMYNPYYYSLYSPWNNPYSYYPYVYVNQNNSNAPTIMPNRGVTSGLAPSSSLVSSGGSRPPLGGRNNTGTVIPNDIGVNNSGGLTPARSNPNAYTTPRPQVEPTNKPPKTFTGSGELNTGRPSTNPPKNWTPTDSKPNTSPVTQPSNTNRPPVYTAPTDSKPNSEPIRNNRPPVNNTPKGGTDKTPKSSWTPPANNSHESSKPSHSEPSSRPAPSISAPSRSGGGSVGGGRRPK